MRVAIGGHLPTLDLVAGRSYTEGNSDQILDGEPFSGVDNKFNDRQIGLQFTLPIFSGGFTQSKVRENEYRWIAAKEAVVAELARHRARRRATAYLGVISGIARVQALRQAQESSQTALQAPPRRATRSARAPRSTCSTRAARWCRRRPTTPAAAMTTS